MKRTRQEALETRDRILDSAEVVFSTRGVTHSALEDIANAAGFTRGAIYGHFRNKAEVLEAMIDRVRLPIDGFMAATADPKAEDPLGLMRGLLVKLLRDAATDEHVHRVLQVLFVRCEYSEEIGGLLGRLTEADRQGRARLASGLRNAARKGQLPADLDDKRAAAALHASISGTLRLWLLDDAALALPRDASRIADALLDMLRFSPALRRRPRASAVPTA